MIEQKMTQDWQRAFILHSKAYTETSLWIDLFVESKGKISVIAKGARRKKSAIKGDLQVFTPLMVQYYGKSNVKVLTKAEALSLPLPLTGKDLFSGFYLNELVHRVIMPEMDTTTLFMAYLSALKQLAQQQKAEQVLRKFEFELLEYLGYSIDFSHCSATGEAIEADLLYQFHSEKGFICSMLNNSLAYRGKDIIAFKNREFDADTLKTARKFTQKALKQYVGNAPFKSRELFISYK